MHFPLMDWLHSGFNVFYYHFKSTNFLPQKVPSYENRFPFVKTVFIQTTKFSIQRNSQSIFVTAISILKGIFRRSVHERFYRINWFTSISVLALQVNLYQLLIARPRSRLLFLESRQNYGTVVVHEPEIRANTLKIKTKNLAKISCCFLSQTQLLIALFPMERIVMGGWTISSGDITGYNNYTSCLCFCVKILFGFMNKLYKHIVTADC